MSSDEATASTLILVVDDDALIRANLRDVLEFAGYAVVTARGATEGLDLLHTMPLLPRLVISDLSMPEMNGYEFLQAIRAEPQWDKLAFILLSGKDGIGATLGSVPNQKVIEFLSKPYGLQDLLTLVQRVISQTDVG